MRHRLATLVLQLAPAVIVPRLDERNGNKRVRCRQTPTNRALKSNGATLVNFMLRCQKIFVPL